MLFYDVDRKQGTQFFDGEWSPYPRDPHAYFIDTELPAGTHVKVVRGARPGDAIFATPNVVSHRFIEVLECCNATGYRTFPVPLVKNGVEVALFCGLRVHGRGGAFDPVRSNADMREGGISFGQSAVYMDETGWDGSDIFFIPGQGVSLFVTEKVGMAIKKAKLRNVQVTVNTEAAWGSRVDYEALRNKPAKRR